MRKFNYSCSILLAILLPLMIVILSSNLILRVSEPYVYHFNDSQIINEVPYNVTGSEMAGAISKYWSSPNSKAFQVYEDNGAYKDPIIEEDEQQVMEEAKIIINVELAFGLIALVLVIAIYIYLWRGGFKEALRNRFYAGAGLTLALLIAQAVCWSVKPFRLWIYNTLIGVRLGKESLTIQLVLGDPFFKTYVLFATIAGIAILAVLTYVNHQITKPTRIFY